MPYLMKKVRILKILIENFSQQKFIQTIQQRPSISKLCQILAKIIENVKKKLSSIHTTFNLDNFL